MCIRDRYYTPETDGLSQSWDRGGAVFCNPPYGREIGTLMIKTARQLKDLIRNLSKDKSADAQILMRNYMMERFLERISLSEYRDKFILKGGMLVAAMVGLDARSTMEQPFSMQMVSLSRRTARLLPQKLSLIHISRCQCSEALHPSRFR